VDDHAVRPDLPSGTVTFLFTDVEGSTRLLRELGAEAYASALAKHRAMIREACASQGGVEVDTQGDAFFFAFGSAPEALAAAASFTEALDGGPISVRVGLHTGTPLLTAEGYVGDDVHLAARVAASGHGGQVVLSPSTRELLAEDVVVCDLGEHRLKDIEQAVSLFQLGEETFPPLKTISNTNLPRPASSFLGREAELANIRARIEQGARLLTLTGPGGTGKTRLALEVAASLVPAYKAGVFWVGLASLRDPALVPEAITQVLGASDGLAEHVGERELLLLLDNLEQVVEAAPDLSELLSACPNLTLLCTSRELLRISGEVEYAVPPLAEPEAISLFCARSALDPSSKIGELCARLDSLPLAVELAAARTKALTPAQILERLSSRLDLLKGRRDADPRQQTLRATIEWSYELLTPAEQRLFARLSVFAGGCTLEAAEEVCDADLDTLQSLIEKSLLRFSNTRYWMLETIREYEGERLVDLSELEEVRAAHLRAFTSLAERAAPHLERGEGQEQWLRRIEAERDNFREALERAASENDEALARIAVGIWRFWWLRGYADEGRRWLNLVLRADANVPALRVQAFEAAAYLNYIVGAYGQARKITEEWLSQARASNDIVSQGMAMHSLANLAAAAGDHERGIELDEESLVLLGDDPYGRYPYSGLGYRALLEGDVARAEPMLGRALELERAVEDHEGVANILALLGMAALIRGDDDRAATMLRESAEVSLSLGYSWQVATRSLQGIAALLARKGKTTDAARLLGVADAILAEKGLPLGPLAERMQAEVFARTRSELGDKRAIEVLDEGRKMYAASDLETVMAHASASLD
jgi:predicted ATPase/class 3 adenylate cyclase